MFCCFCSASNTLVAHYLFLCNLKHNKCKATPFFSLLHFTSKLGCRSVCLLLLQLIVDETKATPEKFCHLLFNDFMNCRGNNRDLHNLKKKLSTSLSSHMTYLLSIYHKNVTSICSFSQSLQARNAKFTMFPNTNRSPSIQLDSPVVLATKSTHYSC